MKKIIFFILWLLSISQLSAMIVIESQDQWDNLMDRTKVIPPYEKIIVQNTTIAIKPVTSVTPPNGIYGLVIQNCKISEFDISFLNSILTLEIYSCNFLNSIPDNTLFLPTNIEGGMIEVLINNNSNLNKISTYNAGNLIVNSRLEIKDNPNLKNLNISGIVGMNGLHGTIIITNNESLRTINSPSITEARVIEISDNSELESMSNWNFLNSVDWNLIISNSKLEQINQFISLKNIEIRLEIENNMNLASIQFSFLERIGTEGKSVIHHKYLQIENNENLELIELPLLTEIDGTLIIKNCDKLEENFDFDFSNLITVKELVIEDNLKLKSLFWLDGMSNGNLEAGGIQKTVQIANNTNLSDCAIEAICCNWSYPSCELKSVQIKNNTGCCENETLVKMDCDRNCCLRTKLVLNQILIIEDINGNCYQIYFDQSGTLVSEPTNCN